VACCGGEPSEKRSLWPIDGREDRCEPGSWRGGKTLEEDLPKGVKEMGECQHFIDGKWRGSFLAGELRNDQSRYRRGFGKLCCGKEQDVLKAASCSGKILADWKRFPAPSAGDPSQGALPSCASERSHSGRWSPENGESDRRGEGEVAGGDRLSRVYCWRGANG